MNSRKYVFWTLILIVALVLTGILGSQFIRTSNALAGPRTLVGSWTTTVTPEGGEPSFVDAVIFSSDGTVTAMESDGRLGIGVWRKISGASYAFNFWEFVNEGGAAMQIKISSTIQLSKDGEHYSGPFTVEVRDTAGNLLGTGGGTASGDRQHVEPME